VNRGASAWLRCDSRADVAVRQEPLLHRNKMG
jgi:hypothetical protein